jgi:hypothetical protein
MSNADTHLLRKLFAALAIACACAQAHGALATDPPAADAKPAPPAKPATIKGAMADVGDISSEVRKLEKHIAAIEQSVAEINESAKHVESMDRAMTSMGSSLVPVGALARPEGLNALLKQVSDVAYGRGVALILVATGCVALLLVLFAFLLRWVLRSQAHHSK